MKRSVFSTPILSRVLHYLAVFTLFITGWKVKGKKPDDKKFIMLGAPHTSNWDFVMLLFFALYARCDVRWMGKDSLFPFPIRSFMLWLGGIPIDRSKNNNMVDQVAQVFKASERLIVVIPPEGTRKKVERWKTGFYYIAREADVPVVCGYVDYAKKELGFGPIRKMGEDVEKELADIKVFYSGVTPKYPEKF